MVGQCDQQAATRWPCSAYLDDTAAGVAALISPDRFGPQNRFSRPRIAEMGEPLFELPPAARAKRCKSAIGHLDSDERTSFADDRIRELSERRDRKPGSHADESEPAQSAAPDHKP